MAQHSLSDFAFCVVSLHEQALGAHNYINQARASAALVRGYELIERLPRDYAVYSLLPFDAGAAAALDVLIATRVRVKAMDLRIAAIALSRGVIVLTRNISDFGGVPGL